MQLFISNYVIKGNEIIITNPDIISQARKVLRLIKGDEFFVQTVRSDIRYKVALIEYGKDSMECNILDKQEKNGVPTTTTMLIAMPNKWEKVELIVQKLCEIGINNIIFRPAERSVIKTWNEKKEERLLKIAKEAVEQSRGWHLPVIESSNDISKHIQDTEVIIFDKIKDEELRSKDSKSKVQGLRSKVGVIGPEGGLTPNDYKLFETTNPEIRDLGDTILRMETAAIVGGRILKNC